ncbi:hypothetical protein [Pedobacter metabolipauper]|uniref:Uncharacterized protein n=1 Tax=Pedobacter metabolipauper TaxID=425513 RepID=A0A4R6SQB1_9SPHI|nr:hypothetical protein [Pedobacter metabolipauper]TDQ06414.1 hypothetical protein ATK78_4484 [Pedobacter metabolipauper]
MKIKLTLFILICGFSIQAQSFKYPAMASQGRTIKSLIPAQWKVIDSVYGDLNRDQIADMALILEFYAPVKESRAYGDNTTEIITEIQKPRILAIYFKSGKSYKLAKQNNNFILRSEEGGAMGDPLRPLHITDNKLNFLFEGGANWRWKLNYTFKFQNNDWLLTQASNNSYHASSGEMNEKQYDFVNKKRLVITGTTFNRESANTSKEEPLQVKQLRTFTSFKKPWTWEISPDEFL